MQSIALAAAQRVANVIIATDMAIVEGKYNGFASCQVHPNTAFSKYTSIIITGLIHPLFLVC